mgnify:CR=1 FL=1
MAAVTVLAILLNILLRSVERRLSEVIRTTATNVAIRAYSMAVAPESSKAKDFEFFSSFRFP